MAHTKRTYALPHRILTSFESLVPPGDRSRVVGELLQNWLDEKEKAAMRSAVIEGCREMAEISLELEREFHPLEEEVHRALDAKPKTRRHRPRSA